MIGVAKLMKQAQKMQKQMEELQTKVEGERLTFSSGGGAVKIVANGRGDFISLDLDADFLKEDKAFVQSTLLAAMQEASQKPRAQYEGAMGAISGSLLGAH